MKQSGIVVWFSKRYKNLWVMMLMALVIGTLCYQIGQLGFMREFESKTLDFRFRLSPQPAKADTNIVLIAIDDASLRYVVSTLGQGWPWPREFYGVITDYLGQQGAKSIIYDMIFDEADFERADLSSAESDGHFAEAMSRNGNVILGMMLSRDSTAVEQSLTRHSIADASEYSAPISEWAGANSPIPLFNESARQVSTINLLDDRDAIIRKVPLLYSYNGRIYPSMAYAAYQHAKEDDLPFHEARLAGYPLVGRSEFYINWYGDGGADGVFRYLPISALLQSAVAAMYGTEASLPDGIFRDKHVIIGATAAGLMDLKTSPYTWGMPGMEVWATTLSNLLNRDFVRFPAPLVNFLLIYLVTLLVIVAVSRVKSGYSPLLVILLFVALLVAGHALFASSRIAIELSSPLLSLVVSWVLILTLSYIMEGKHKRELRLIFNRYLHPDLVNRIVDNPELVQMGGDELECTVMFSDIYNFTGFSENQTPKQLVSYLNEYFSTFTNSILDHNGLLDKYTGDGLMAVFGAPILRQDHALMACKAALAHRDYSLKFKDLPELTPSQAFHLNTRLGLNSGLLVAGNIGSERRMEYTSIGDTVNLSARLEGVNKVFKTHIIISESTYVMVAKSMFCRELDYLRVKGKKEPTRIYELLCEKDSPKASEYGWISTYAKGLELYRKGNFTEAKACFEELIKAPIKDGASETMANRCEYLMAKPPANWDGILTLEEK